MEVKKTKKEYLCHTHKTVAIKNEKGELEIKPSKFCQAGDTVWILSSDDKFIKTIIFYLPAIGKSELYVVFDN